MQAACAPYCFGALTVAKRAIAAAATRTDTAPPMARANPSEETIGIDAILEGLESVVKELESKELPLERALERFEEGVKLARRGSALLDAVEERVETLLADRDETVPMQSSGSEDEET